MPPPVNGVFFRMLSNIVRNPSTLDDNLKEQQKLELDQYRIAIKIAQRSRGWNKLRNYLMISKNATDAAS